MFLSPWLSPRNLVPKPFFFYWCLLAADACCRLWKRPAFFDVCVSHSYNLWYSLPFLPHCDHLSFFLQSVSCCHVCAQAPPTLLRPFYICFVVCTIFVGSGHNRSFISVNPRSSVQIIPSFMLICRLCGTITSYLGHCIPKPLSCDVTELPGLLHSFQLTFFQLCTQSPFSSLPHFLSNNFWPSSPHSLWPTHFPTPCRASPRTEPAMLSFSCQLPQLSAF